MCVFRRDIANSFGSASVLCIAEAFKVNTALAEIDLRRGWNMTIYMLSNVLLISRWHRQGRLRLHNWRFESERNLEFHSAGCAMGWVAETFFKFYFLLRIIMSLHINQVTQFKLLIQILFNRFVNATNYSERVLFTSELLILLLLCRRSTSLLTSYSKLLINLTIGHWWIENSKLIRLLRLIRVVNVFDLWENKLLKNFKIKMNLNLFCVVFCYLFWWYGCMIEKRRFSFAKTKKVF